MVVCRTFVWISFVKLRGFGFCESGIRQVKFWCVNSSREFSFNQVDRLRERISLTKQFWNFWCVNSSSEFSLNRNSIVELFSAVFESASAKTIVTFLVAIWNNSALNLHWIERRQFRYINWIIGERG